MKDASRRTGGGDPGKGKSEFTPVDQSDNQAYVTLASQLAGTRSDIESVQRQVKDAEKKRVEYQRRIEASPRVDETYKALMVERNNIQAKFDDLTRKSMEAKVAQGLEKGQMGERFTLIDPARLPEKPVKPNRLAIILIGFILGIGAGVGMMALQEAMDHSVRDSRTLAAMTGVPVLGTIPAIVTRKDTLTRMKRRRFIAVSILAGIVVALILVHLLVADFTCPVGTACAEASMTKKKHPFVQQDNSSLEARDYSYHRKERDTARGFIGQKTTFFMREVKYRMEVTTLTWWVRMKHFVKGLFFRSFGQRLRTDHKPRSEKRHRRPD